jgi:predicted MarR family transcription regulator
MIHYKAAFVNSSVTQTETALVHSIDHIASLISYALHEAEEGDHHVQFSFKKMEFSRCLQASPAE